MRRLLTIFLVLLALGVAIAALGIAVAGRRTTPVLAGDRIVTLALGGDLADYRPPAPIAWLEEREPLHLAGLWQALDRARRDDSVRAVAVRIRDLGFGMAKAQEVRRLFSSFAGARKPVACYLDTAGEGTNGTLEYYVASACSEISLSPLGELSLLGLDLDAMFFRGTLEKLRIEPSFLTTGRYKSAAETYTERAHSPAAREALESVIDSFYRQIVSGIATARGVLPESVRTAIDAAPFSAARALDLRLVDRVEYPDEFRARLDDEHDGPAWVDLDAHAAGRGARADDEIAVVFALGTIVRGSGGLDPWGGERFIGSESFGQLLADLEEDDGVRAVVLRIDSGGGSALASDLIHRRVELLSAAKPVVVSMSDLAASGGYYMAAKASRIYAEPATLTGSIGVVGGKFATRRFEEELLGATRDPISRGAHSGIYSPRAPFTDEERHLLGARMDEIYRRFVGVVAAGRELPTVAVERVAEGRIWTGQEARAHGLVDELGGLDAALAAARELAGMAPREGVVRFRPRARGFWEWLSENQTPTFRGEFRRLAELARMSRVPEALELPPGFRRLTRPF
jgi:protease-4